MRKSELCAAIIKDDIKSFNKINKNTIYINKIKRDHKKLLVDNEKVLEKQKEKHEINQKILKQTVSLSEYEELRKQHQQLLKNYKLMVQEQKVKQQANKKILKSTVISLRVYEANYKNSVASYKFNSHRLDKNLGIEEFLDKYMPDMKELLIQALKKYKGIKFNSA
jgi:hypothetical protein